jgi:hypothetical protein
MKKIGLAVAGAALVAALAAPAGAALVPGSSDVLQHGRTRLHECYGHRDWNDRGECDDERRPQHDGGGSTLF